MRSGPKISAIVLVILELTLCLIIYLACVCIRRRRCQRSNVAMVLPRSSDSSGSGSPLGRPGPEPVLIFFPYKVLKGLFPLGKELGSLQCAACLDEFKEDDSETLRLIHKCGHVFHHKCVDPSVGSCPCCRAEEPDLRPDGGGDCDCEDVVVEIEGKNDEEGMIKLPEEVREKITVHGKLVLPRWEPSSTNGYRS